MFETIEMICSCGAQMKFTGEAFRINTLVKDFKGVHDNHTAEGTMTTLLEVTNVLTSE